MHFEKEISQKTVYEGKILKVKQYQVELENGKITQRDVIRHNGAVALVAVKDNGNILFVKQFRFPVAEETLEIPAGKIDLGESIENCALRELEEETGYISDNIVKIGQMYPTCAYSDEVIHIFLAENLKKTKQNLDDDEFLSVIEIPLEKALNMIVNGEVPDAKTQLGILLYNKIKNNR